MQKRPGYSLGEGPMPTTRTLRGKREESAIVRLVVKYWPALPILLLIVMLRWRFQHGHDKAQLKAFVNFSGYRIGGGEFVAVGLAPLSRRGYTKFHGCSWKDNGAGARAKPIPGKLKPLYPGEHHFLPYEALVLNCKLRHPTDASKGGKLTMSIDDKTHLVYHEEPNAFPLGLNPAPPYKHHVVFCSPPVHSKVDAKRIYEWLEFHFHIGIDYVIIYDAGGITDDVLQTLLPYELQGRLEVRDIGEALNYESWLYAQVMVINDCAYSTRYSSKWTIFFDFDEFLNADEPPPPEKKQVQYLAQQQELNAAAHWGKQWERLQRSHHREEIARARRELVGGELVTVRREKAEEGVYEPMAHPAKYSLEERKKLERSEEEEQRQRAIKLRQDRNYLKVKRKRKELGMFQKNPSVSQKKKILMDELHKQQQQLELIKAHREHLKAKNEAEKLLPLVLDSYEEASYVSFGTLWWDVERCVLETEAIGEWAVQRMLYHWPHIYCMKPEWFPRAEACLDYHGHRKYAVNPRKVTALQIHRPEINDTVGYDLDTSVAKMNHFQGIVNLHSKTCTEIVKLEDDLVWWARGHEISNAASKAQLSPTSKFAGYHYPEEMG